MWTLKDDSKIVIKKHGLVITRQSLARNQALANVVLEDHDLFRKYGHNFVQAGSGKQAPAPRPNEVVIEVNVKKKADALKESGEPVSTSTEVQTGGGSLNVNEVKQEPRSGDTQQLNRKQRRERLKQQK